MSWIKALLGLVLFSALLTYVVIPTTASFFTRFRLQATKLSPLSARGIEWRSKAHALHSVPTLSIERIFWTWGGCAPGSRVTLNVEGITVRVRQKEADGAAHAKKRKGLPPTVHRAVNRIAHLFVGHWSYIASLFSVRIADVRVILEDVGGAEATITELHFGLTRTLPAAPSHPLNPDDSKPPMSSLAESPSLDASAGPSGTSAGGFFQRPPQQRNGPHQARGGGLYQRSGSRLESFHRRASLIHSTVHSAMSKTASHLWSHATGTIIDRVTFTLSVGDIELSLPTTGASARVPDATSMPNLTKRASNASFASTSRGISSSISSSLGPLNSFLKLGPSSSNLRADVSYEKLVVVEGHSSVTLCVGFGPNRPLLSPENLATVVNVGTLHVSLDGIDKITDLARAHRTKRNKSRDDAAPAPASAPATKAWSEDSTPRVILRAFEFATLSLSQVHVSHLLPSVAPRSTRSSATDVSELPNAPSRHYTLSLDLADISLEVSGCNASNNDQLAKVFGSNVHPASLIHGIGAKLQWHSIELQCIAPGETVRDRSQLVAIRRGEFDVITTWRPEGWERKQLLFADDVNLSVLLARGYVASIDVAGDLQLCSELHQSWMQTHERVSNAPKRKRVRQSHLPLVPKFRVLLDIGPISIVLANQASKDAATLNLGTDGLFLGGHSSYSDITAPMQPEPSGKPDKAKAETTDEPNAASATVDLTEEHPEKTVRGTPDLTLSLRSDSFISVEPISLRMSLGSRNERTYRIATLGRIEGKLIGDMYGSSSLYDGVERHYLVKESLDADVNLSCDYGLRIEMWHSDVIDALTQLAGMKEPSPPKPPGNLLDKLPSGITLRLSLGTVSVFIGHEDPNPHCDLRIIHGLWLQTTVVFNYAYYKHTASKSRCRHLLNSERRAHFHLHDDLTSKAYSYAEHLEKRGGNAALFSVIISDTAVRPVFNGPQFIARGGCDQQMPPEDRSMPPRPDVDVEYAAWGWSGNKRRDPPRYQPATEHAPKARSFIRAPHIYITGIIHRDYGDAPTAIDVQSRTERVHVNGQLPDIYCTLLAVQTVRVFALAFKKPPPVATDPNKPEAPKRRIAWHVNVQAVWIHFTFPLNESIFFSVSKIVTDKEPDKPAHLGAEHVLLHVQSATAEGLWDELGRIKSLRVVLNLPDVVVAAKAFRLRMPSMFLLSQLILNINVCFKAFKLLFHNLKTGVFHLEKIPGAEGPKNLPNFKIAVDLLHFEARDHDVENRINLNNRVGLAEQKRRLHLEDLFDQKMHLLTDPQSRPINHLTSEYSVEPAEARWRLDWHMSRSWVKRIKKAREHERRKEAAEQRPFKINQDTKLPIHLLPLEQSTPLFRAKVNNVQFNLLHPEETREQLVEYMGEVSAPFAQEQEFSLMVPFNVHLSMGESTVLLRDYPIPLLRIEPVTHGPSWRIKTLFVIAEELPASHVEDSCLFFPVEVLPAQCGHPDAKPLWVQVAKTINPVKTYARPLVSVYSTDATKLAWCNSYQPGFTDVARMFDRLTSPPRDPSPKPGFWDKIRLSLHWRIRMTFAGSFRFYLKGTTDPYETNGYGSGFAVVLRRNPVVEIGQPNKQGELIQFMAEELLVSIPDLDMFQDHAAVGMDDANLPPAQSDADRVVIERRSRKPCARFMNGIRFGLGFKFERTCRPWTCTRGCGPTENLLHRQCRFFDFKPHNAVTLHSPEAIEREEAKVGHPVDSYEGFRSDYIHFSVSLAAPKDPNRPISDGSAAETHNSLHLTPKAFAHFFNWWGLFSSKIPAPIRTGPAFPDTPKQAVKFGKSIATIKYGCDLRPVFVSHVYAQMSQELCSAGRSQYLGVKLRTRRMRIDAHQRMQETRDWNEQLHRDKVVTHKPFNAVDAMLDDIQIVGIVADFDETNTRVVDPPSVEVSRLPRVSEMPKDLRLWYNYFDFIDADRKPFDRNPRIEIVILGDCPHVFFARRIKARKTRPDGEEEQDTSMEASKFGNEKTHVCYLGTAAGLAETQQNITAKRILELSEALNTDPERCIFEGGPQAIEHRINTLHNYIDDLSTQVAHQPNEASKSDLAVGIAHPLDADDQPFQHTLHVHCPRLYYNNASRNIVFKYLYSRHNRRKEEYTTSHASIRGLREGMKRRKERVQNGLNRDDLPDDLSGEEAGRSLLGRLERIVSSNTSAHFKLSPEFFSDHIDYRRPTIGIPSECSIHPSWRAAVIKPQISLRSSADDGAVVLVAVEEIAFQGFAVQDVQGLDPIAQDVLSRNYLALRGFQAFYPSRDVLMRTCAPKLETGQPSPDFLPLEVFLDVRSETTEYDRIVLKTDMSLHYDHFNHLRIARGLEWPEAEDDAGESIDHLRKHQNTTEIVVPMLTISARPTHYSALYYIVTDLLMYRDPQAEQRNDRINSFMYKFDQRDRDPQELLTTLFLMQQHIRSLAELQRGYQAHVDQLTEEGKHELLKINADQYHERDALYTIFEVINLNRARDEARDNVRTLSRLDVRAGNVAWHMLRDDGDPLVKFNIKHTLGSVENNQDGSTDSAMVSGDLQALNSNADATFPEVISRWDKDKSGKNSKNKRGAITPIVSCVLCLSEQVAGIGIIRNFSIFLHPLRFRLEEEVGTAITDYIFTDRKPERGRKREDSGSAYDHHGHRDKDNSSHTHLLRHSHSSTTLIGAPGASANGKHGAGSASSSPTARTGGTASILAADGLETRPDGDAQEMRQRAKTNRTFVAIVVGSTSVVLDYKRNEKRKHHGLVVPECADFRFQVPNIEYHNEILTFKELFEKVKSDVWSSVWSQKGDLLNQLFKKTSMFRSKKSLRQIAGIDTAVPSPWGKRASPKSPLRFTVQHPSETGSLPALRADPAEMDDTSSATSTPVASHALTGSSTSSVSSATMPVRSQSLSMGTGETSTFVPSSSVSYAASNTSYSAASSPARRGSVNSSESAEHEEPQAPVQPQPQGKEHPFRDMMSKLRKQKHAPGSGHGHSHGQEQGQGHHPQLELLADNDDDYAPSVDSSLRGSTISGAPSGGSGGSRAETSPGAPVRQATVPLV